MKLIPIIFLFFAFFFFVVFQCTAQEKETGNSKITFITKSNDRGKTYLGKLRKGDLNSLRYELQRYELNTGNEIDVNNEKESAEGYINRIVVGAKGINQKKMNKAAQDDLTGNYEVKDTISLNKVKEKKRKTADEKALKRDNTGNYKHYKENQKRKKSALGNYFRVSKTKRLRNGHSFSRPSGGQSLIIVYDIYDGRTINTYIDVVDAYLKPNSRYNLKYHGAGSKRSYYIEYVSSRK